MKKRSSAFISQKKSRNSEAYNSEQSQETPGLSHHAGTSGCLSLQGPEAARPPSCRCSVLPAHSPELNSDITPASILWCWRNLLRVLWTARRSNQSILDDGLSWEFSPGCSLEGLILKLKLQYFGHLMQSRLIGKRP